MNPLLSICLRSSTEHNRVKSSTNVNHGNDKTETQNLMIPCEK